MREGQVDLAAATSWVASIAGPVTGVRELRGGWTSTMLAVSVAGGQHLVLRLMTVEPWRSHGSALTTRESEVQRMLAAWPVPAPRTIALDETGAGCGHPAHLMTLLPGSVVDDVTDPIALGRLATALADIHSVEPSIAIRDYQSWAFEAKYVTPPWAIDPGAWQAAFEVLRTEPPPADPGFLHRDFHPRNVLWSQGRITGVVDWVETSIGPAWLDVAHCSTNLAIRHGDAVADEFATIYADLTGRRPEPYFDVMDVVGFLPPPGRVGLIQDADEQRRLEDRLRAVLDRLGA